MAQALILDAEALTALARERQRSVLFRRARAVLRVAHEERALVRVPAPVLAELYRGRGEDAALDRVLNRRGIEVVTLNAATARRAGALLGRARMSSKNAVDAFVVATALDYASSVIATHDPKDIARLAAGERTIRVVEI
jgi:predicted nucleic acid-binding protein